jgi:hypothetical protein
MMADRPRQLTMRLNVQATDASQHTVSTSDWTIQVFSPIALTIAYFSMPQAVIPFEQNVKHFLITIVVMAVIVQLLFFIFGDRVRHWLWRRVGGSAKGAELDRIPSSTGDYLACLVAVLTRRRRVSSDPSLEGTEMENSDSANRV